jgi:pyruvate,water dikinase
LLNIRGDASVIEAVKECWASLFLPRSIFYRVENKIPHESVKISVIVQKMVQSNVSGVMFTIDPMTSDKDRIVIEAVWGLGEMMVQGEVVPDHYVVQKETFAILSKTVSDQSTQLIKVGVETKHVAVPNKFKGIQKISDEQIITLAKYADKLQKHYFFPQDAEWAVEGKDLYIVQTRPITTIKTKQDQKLDISDKGTETALTSILTGSPASPGMGAGPVKIIKNPKEIGRVEPGDILVSIMTSPDFVPAMKKASAIVTDQGGQTSHAAIVSRELGIPCVVGTKMATTVLKEGMVVTVDGTLGQVFMGSKIQKTEKPVEEKEVRTKTATKVYVNLGELDRVKEVSEMNVEGVGLLRAEFMIAGIGIHPKEAIKNKTQQDFIDKLARNLTKFCEAFNGKPVVYRATDFKTNEYRSLPGGKAWEPEEPNPLMGYRGAFRYIASPEVFNLELQAIKKVREEHKNLWLMIPYVRSPEELAMVRRIVAAEGLFESPTFKFWMMVEIPTNVIQIEDFIKVGIDGVSIGSNDLTMLITGTDRDNPEVAKAFNERSPAVYWALRRVIKKCNMHGVTASICGQAPSTYEDMVRKLVKYGITSMSVNPDAVNRVRKIIMEAEKELISNG